MKKLNDELHNRLRNQVKKLPINSGVYIFRDSRKTVLYVGKATNLRSRVNSYFTGKDSRGERIFRMVEQIETIETIETDTVLEAVILEANLIKKYLPKYNIDRKDDKSFSYFAVTKEDFPRVVIVRETDLESGYRLQVTGDKGREKKHARRYARTYGPYTSKGHMETVLKILRKIFPFHSGGGQTEKGCLYRQIGLCSGPYDGGITKEEYRKNIRNIEYVLRGQKRRLLGTLEKEMQASAKREDFEWAQTLRDQVFALKHIRDIALLTRDLDPKSHSSNSFVPSSKFQVPRIEAYDISNISGEYAVASMVVFMNGEPKRSEYRKFKIKSVKGTNDIAMMREVLARRLRHDEWKKPDMIVLDGGKGHLNMAEKLWGMLAVNIPLLAIAKGPTRKKVDLYSSKKFPPHPDLLKNKLLLEHLREEAHRFAIGYHRNLRGRKFIGRKKKEK